MELTAEKETHRKGYKSDEEVLDTIQGIAEDEGGVEYIVFGEKRIRMFRDDYKELFSMTISNWFGPKDPKKLCALAQKHSLKSKALLFDDEEELMLQLKAHSF